MRIPEKADSLAAILSLKRDFVDRCVIAMEQDASRTEMRPARKTAEASFHAAPNPRPCLIVGDLRDGPRSRGGMSEGFFSGCLIL